jgi:hypothetical protein
LIHFILNMDNFLFFNNKKPVLLAGFEKNYFSESDIRELKLFMSGVLPTLVEEINEYFHENMYILMEHPILEVCRMISNRFNRQECEDLCEMMDFVMTSLMGHQKIDMMLYNVDGLFVDIDFRTDDTGDIDSIYITSVKPGSIVSGGSLNLLRKLGSGTFADVFLVECRQNSSSPLTQFAMKFFKADFWKRAMKDIVTELNILHIISGIDGVIKYDFVLKASVLGEEHWAYGMKYFRNNTMNDYTTGLTRTEILKMLEPLAQTMKKCHDEGVFHCDLKPDNILIWVDGKPVLSDWGIAKRTSSKCWIFNVSILIYTEWYRDRYLKPYKTVPAGMSYAHPKG